jgi:hypothetical protein
VQFCAGLAVTSGKRQEMSSYKSSHCTTRQANVIIYILILYMERWMSERRDEVVFMRSVRVSFSLTARVYGAGIG